MSYWVSTVVRKRKRGNLEVGGLFRAKEDLTPKGLISTVLGKEGAEGASGGKEGLVKG